MKYQLTLEEEKRFWKQVEKDLKQSPFSENPSNWNTKAVEAFQRKMHQKFLELYKKDKKINHLLEIEDFNRSPLLKGQMTSKILSIFRYRTSRTTRETTKNRFTIYLKEQSADVYIEDNNIFDKEGKDTSTLIDSPLEHNETIPLQLFAYDDFWVGRNKTILDLADRLKSQCRILLILGITGIGKTALAECLLLRLNLGSGNDEFTSFQRISFDHPSKNIDFSDVAIQWLEGWGIKLITGKRTPELLLHHLIAYLHSNHVLILIDSLEALLKENEKEGHEGNFKDEWWGKFFFQILSLESFKSKIIISSQELPAKFEFTRYQNFLHRHILLGLNDFEQIELFKKMDFDMKEHSIDKSMLLRLGKAYKGHPLVLRVIAGEIIEDYHRNVQAYWNIISSKVIAVEKAIEEAENNASKLIGKQDEWQLHKLTRKINGQVNKERLELVFNRLFEQAYDAYILICAASIYRIPVLEIGWLMQLEGIINFIEKRECSQERKEQALEGLRKRFLVEISFNDKNQRMLGQHNLIRSVALEYNKKLTTKQKPFKE